MEVTFDEAKHEYRAGGVIVPSVTGVIPNDWKSVRRIVGADNYEAARKDGVECHKKVEEYLKGMRKKVPRSDAFLCVFEQFYQHQKIGDLVACEETLYSKRYGFAGRPDMGFERAGVDLKRSLGDVKKHALQMAGYNILFSENGLAKKNKMWWILVVKDGAYKLVNVYNRLAENMFLALVQKKKIEKSLENYYKTV